MNEDIRHIYECVLQLNLKPRQNWLDRLAGTIRLDDPHLGTIMTAHISDRSTAATFYELIVATIGNARIKNGN